jgi:16S rRNA G966 N2-methylase RsmD
MELMPLTGNFLPKTGSSVSNATLIHCLNDIIINERKSVIEFGSGISTFYFARLLKEKNIKGSFISIENDEKWINILKQQLESEELSDFVTIHYIPSAPLSNPSSKINNLPEEWYDQSLLFDLIKNKKFDFVFVDAPIDITGKFNRYPALPFLFEKKLLNDEYTVILDDCDRMTERIEIEAWSKLLNEDFHIFTNYGMITNSHKLYTVPLHKKEPAF